MKRKIVALMSGGLVGKIVGVGRELLVASLYGTGSVASAYRLAQAALFIPINFFTADVLNAAVIPLQRQYQRSGDKEAEVRFATIVLVGFGLFGLLLGLVMVCFASEIVHVLAPAFNAPTHAGATLFLQILSLAAPLYILAGLMSYLEMGAGGHTLTSARATVQSVGLIASTCAAYFLGQAALLATGFVLAQIVCCLWGWKRLTTLGLIRRTSMSLGQVKEVVQRLVRLMRPLLLLPILMQGNFAVERIIATRLADGAVAAIDYARLVSDTVNVLIAVPFALAVLSELAGKSAEEIRKTLLGIAIPLTLLTVPASAFLCVHAREVVTLMYGRGAFDERSIQLTSAILATMSIGLWAQALGYIAQKALSAQLRNRTAVAFMAISLAISVAINLIASRWIGVAAIGLAVTSYGVVNSVMAARAFGYNAKELSPIAWMIGGEIAYVALSMIIEWPPGLKGLSIAAVASGIFWLVWIGANCGLRQTLLGYMKTRVQGRTI
ncbi:murein biosynthesis integral membrane protein MurJ [Caballeronia sp. GaOx3]|uniref:murein biosynthesis integral membrane protein MurJ n=1 Tax=Caballeronia sp. GaOx3 TaxID=2921740 RepID=UPI0020279E24|nr:lipid II flippase MurJ [Caballeronia sp. GaOx3]